MKPYNNGTKRIKGKYGMRGIVSGQRFDSWFAGRCGWTSQWCIRCLLYSVVPWWFVPVRRIASISICIKCGGGGGWKEDGRWCGYALSAGVLRMASARLGIPQIRLHRQSGSLAGRKGTAFCFRYVLLHRAEESGEIPFSFWRSGEACQLHVNSPSNSLWAKKVRACSIRVGSMSRPVTRQLVWAQGSRLPPSPQPTSSTLSGMFLIASFM